MNRTKLSAPPSSRHRPLPPFRSCDARQQVQQRRLATTRRKAETLLQDGYQFRLAVDTPGRLLVFKPGRDPEQDRADYHLDFSWDEAEQKWRAVCPCPQYQGLVSAQRFDRAVEPECKHADAGLDFIRGAMRVADHIRAVLPDSNRYAVQANVMWEGGDRRAAARETDDRHPCHPCHPWPTQRGTPVGSRRFDTAAYERQRDADFA
jgi:hypothetical protein